METLFQRLGRQLRSLFLKQLALGLAFLLAVLGVWALKRWKHGSRLLVLFCFLSLGIYQAYVSTAVFLLLLLGLEDLLRGKPIKQVYGRLIKEMLL